MTTTCACSRTVGDGATLCGTCTSELQDLLGAVAALVDDLAITRSRQSRMSDRSIRSSPSAERPLPFDQRAADATERLREVLRACVALVLSHHPDVAAPARDLASLSRWLLGQVSWLRQQPEAPVAFTGLAEAVRRAQQVIDRPAERRYLGPCSEPVEDWTDGAGAVRQDCPAELWAGPSATLAACPACGAEHDVSLRRKWLLEAAEQQLETAAGLSQALSRLGQGVTASQIRGWAFRGRLLAHSTDLDGRPLYRVGDVLDVLADVQRRKAPVPSRVSPG